MVTFEMKSSYFAGFRFVLVDRLSVIVGGGNSDDEGGVMLVDTGFSIFGVSLSITVG